MLADGEIEGRNPSRGAYSWVDVLVLEIRNTRNCFASLFYWTLWLLCGSMVGIFRWPLFSLFSRLRASHPLYPSPDVYTRRCNVETHPMQPFTKPVSSTAMSANQLTDSYYCFLEYHAVSISMRATGRKWSGLPRATNTWYYQCATLSFVPLYFRDTTGHHISLSIGCPHHWPRIFIGSYGCVRGMCSMIQTDQKARYLLSVLKSKSYRFIISCQTPKMAPLIVFITWDEAVDNRV